MSKVYSIREILNDFDSLKNKLVNFEGYISKVEILEKKDKSEYLKCVLGDSDGEIQAKLWNEKESLEINYKMNDSQIKIAKIKTQVLVKEWLEKPDLEIKNFEIYYEESKEESFIDMIEHSKNDPDTIFEKLTQYINKVKDKNLKNLLLSLFSKSYVYPSKKIEEKFKNISHDYLFTTSAISHHHNYIHGHLEHSVGVLDNAYRLADYYKNIFEVDFDLLITGSVLHDLGKIREYTYKNGIDRSLEGKYIYHTVSGAILLSEMISDLELDIDSETKMKLIHIITSHHGEYSEYAPNELCPEAHLISIADLADSQANKVLRQSADGTLKRMKNKFS